ncbi:MAG TPA: hypothetical protein VFW19_08670 [Allosphingosinicella sp.]|nr:hypothetical protein [Allosphingosinicella sp.]
MDRLFALLAVSAAVALQPPAAQPVPDSAVTLVPVTLVELRHYGDILIALAGAAGVGPGQAPSPAAVARVAPAERTRIIRAHGLSPARFDYIAEQVRYNEGMARVVHEELVVASSGYR